jgi:hypothetical protein
MKCPIIFLFPNRTKTKKKITQIIVVNIAAKKAIKTCPIEFASNQNNLE